MVRDIPGDDGADEGASADGVPADNGAVRSQGGAFLDERRADLIHLGDFGLGL